MSIDHPHQEGVRRGIPARRPYGRAQLAVATVVALGVGSTLLGSARAAAPDTSARVPCHVRLLFHGGVHGEIVDCGCKMKPLGGLARRAALIEQLSDGRSDVAVVDAGGLFGDDTPEQRARTSFLVEQTAALPYDALGVGAADLGLGLQFLQQAHDRNHLQFTSANVLHNGQPLFDPFRVVERGGTRVGFVSVLDPAVFPAGKPLPDGVTLEEPAAALRRVLPQLRTKADVIVLLAHTQHDGLDALLSALGGDAGIDVAVDGGAGVPQYNARRVGTTLVVGANGRGKFLGQLDLAVAADGAVTDTGYTLHELALSLPENPQLAQRVEAFRAKQGQVAQKQ